MKSFTKEQRLFLGMQAGVLAYAFASAKNVSARRRKIIQQDKKRFGEDAIQRVPNGGDKVVDHPALSWVLDNFAKVAIACAGIQFRKKFTFGTSLPARILKEMANVAFLQECTIAWHWILVNKVYSHIPFFDKNRKNQSVKESLKDYMNSNMPVIVIIALLETFFLKSARELQEQKITFDKRFKPFKFLVKLLYVRVVTDLFFWLGHKLIHRRENYWIHKKHHEHNKTRIWTNYHFSLLDLLIEAFIPFLVATLSLGAISNSMYLPEEEIAVIGSYIIGLEVNSHAGKPLPTMSVFPPLGPLLSYWDDWNVWFHETHHNRLKCNYSITPYWDHIFGTARYE
mmetsp:Transcript_8955/g.10268  ORF Transcript_8955/g.10268 Transcript_8955/m.10268 type:complete len:341 (+) Transcript_8955:77-1099(+)|eukprot:CAMPEP_0184015888 /NCGR_PEP_ID=MMETSP0954-20121128/6608_1 /TAXON_ID=627963 /ORGANISM="Aplanochytrium sp, Strain PBS07" /LENGTH=340 /DNA_ID=CAMNT_0026296817 /DNA_START=3128 /DNA_END=4150 /DNA_ORIENTATION=+